MKMYDVVLKNKTQNDEKFKTTILNSFDDLNKAKTFMRDEARNTLSSFGTSLLDNFPVGNCKYESTEESVSTYCSNGDEDESFDQYYIYSIEERDIDEKYLMSMPVYVVTEEKRDSDRDYFFYVLKVFNEKYKAIEYRDKLIQKTLDKYYDSKIDPNDKNTVIYEEYNGCIDMDCYIKYEIVERKIQ